jgi:hypothetical protein
MTASFVEKNEGLSRFSPTEVRLEIQFRRRGKGQQSF